MNLKLLKSSQKKKVLEKLNEQFGITNLPFLLIESGKEKLRAFSGTLNRDEIFELSKITNIETIGIYLAKHEEGKDIRLSIDACHLLKDQISKNIVLISPEDLKLWIRGHDLDIKTAAGAVIIKSGDDFVGCGVSNSEKIYNYIPKERRIRK